MSNERGPRMEFEKEPTREKLRNKVERQPESHWVCEEDQHLLIVNHTNNNGQEYSGPIIQRPKEDKDGYTTLKVRLNKGDTKLEVIPLHIQTYGREIQPIGKITKLKACIQDEKFVSWIGFTRGLPRNENRMDVKFFFEKNGKPGRYSLGGFQYSEWQEKRPRVIDFKMDKLFMDLAAILSGEARSNLIYAVNLLSE